MAKALNQSPARSRESPAGLAFLGCKIGLRFSVHSMGVGRISLNEQDFVS